MYLLYGGRTCRKTNQKIMNQVQILQQKRKAATMNSVPFTKEISLNLLEAIFHHFLSQESIAITIIVCSGAPSILDWTLHVKVTLRNMGSVPFFTGSTTNNNDNYPFSKVLQLQSAKNGPLRYHFTGEET